MIIVIIPDLYFRAEEDCIHIIERITMEYQEKHDSMKMKLADIVCYADEVTQVSVTVN